MNAPKIDPCKNDDTIAAKKQNLTPTQTFASFIVNQYSEEEDAFRIYLDLRWKHKAQLCTIMEDNKKPKIIAFCSVFEVSYNRNDICTMCFIVYV